MNNLEILLTKILSIQEATIEKIKTITNAGGAVQVQLIDPGQYTAFQVTATNQKKTQAITLLVAGQSIGASANSIGTYDVDIDWGDGTISRHTDTVMVASKTGADNQAVWKNQSMSYYNYTFTTDRMDVYYTHTYAETGTYKIKILGTTYYQFRCNTEATNIITRCMQYDLPLYSGLKRLQGAFAKSKALVKVDCPKNYQWPENLKDTTSLFDQCSNLVSVGQMTFPNTTLSMNRTFYGTKIEKGVYIPDSVINAAALYYECSELIYAPNTGKNNRAISSIFKNCIKLVKVDGQISKQTRFADSAFYNTPSLIHTPKFESGIVYGNSDEEMNEAWKDSGGSYTLKNAIKNMFTYSGIINAPENLGTCIESLDITAEYMFSNCKNLISFPALPIGVKSCKQTFQYCYNAARLHKDSGGNIDTIPESATDMTNTFACCYSLIQVQDIPNNVTTAQSCYYYCLSLNDTGNIFSGTYTGLTNIASMFSQCRNLTAFNSRIPTTVTNMSKMFNNCYNLKKIYYLDWLKASTPITNMSYAFYNCYSLNKFSGTIPNTVINASNAFMNCHNAITLPVFNTKNSSACTNMSSLYYGCRNLQMNISSIITIPFSSSSSINVSNMFNGCQNVYGSKNDLETVGNKLWNSGKTFTNTSSTFTNCSKSLKLYIPTTWGGLKAE